MIHTIWDFGCVVITGHTYKTQHKYNVSMKNRSFEKGSTKYVARGDDRVSE